MSSPISTLTRNLRWLARTVPVRKQCFIVATPDPRTIEPGFYPRRDYPQYMLRFGIDRGIETKNYAYYLPSFAYAYNITIESDPDQYIPSRRLKALKYSKLDSKWCPIVVTGQTNSEGKTAREVLLDVIEIFPTYNLGCAMGRQEAIEDMEERFAEVGAHEHPDKI